VVTVGEAELDDPSFKNEDHLLNDFLYMCKMRVSVILRPKSTQLPNVKFRFKSLMRLSIYFERFGFMSYLLLVTIV
jgi:hypothetical protein